MAHCRQHDLDLETTEALLLHVLEHQIIMEERMALDLTNLTAAVDANTNASDRMAAVIEEGVTALNDLAAKLGAAGNSTDQAAVDALATKLSTAATELANSSASLSAAVTTDDPAGAPTPTTGSAGSASAPEPAPAPEPVTPTPPAVGVTTLDSNGRPLYLPADPNQTVDGSVWILSNLRTADGLPLYTFTGDTDATPTGGSDAWAVYTGSTLAPSTPGQSVVTEAPATGPVNT